MKGWLSRYRLLLGVLAFEAVLAVVEPTAGRASLSNAAGFLWEVLQVLPPVMVLMGLFDVWIPKQAIERGLGERSGLVGMLLAVLLGTAAAGPIYAAFPVAVSLRRKGARLANIGVFLGTWAAIKIPMILMESSFIGLRFALVRLALTVPGVMAVGLLLERLVGEDALPEIPAADEAAA